MKAVFETDKILSNKKNFRDKISLKGNYFQIRLYMYLKFTFKLLTIWYCQYLMTLNQKFENEEILYAYSQECLCIQVKLSIATDLTVW